MDRSGEGRKDLDALRRAVYARDAPAGAAEAYAAALGTRGRASSGPSGAAPSSPAGGTPAAAPRRHRRWAAVGAASGVAATLVLGAVLAGRTVNAPPVPRAAAVPTTTATSSPTSTPLPSIAPPPVPGPVLATFTSTGGAVDARLDAGRRTVVISAECGGDGVLTIRLSDGSNTDLACGDGTAGLSMMQSGKPLGRFTVSASITGHPLWALTVGVVLNEAE